MTVIEIDQFTGPTPYTLRRQPILFADLLREVQDRPEQFTIVGWRAPRVRDVADDVTPEMATTLYREGADGYVEIWRARWDTSG